MTDNESHPLFRKDEALIHEFNSWYVRSAENLQSITKKREMLGYLDNANSMARNAKQQIASELDKNDATSGPRSNNHDKQRLEIFSRYSAVNDRLWDRRGQLGTQLDTMLNRQDIKSDQVRDRMPAHIVAAAKTSLDQQKAASAFDRLMGPLQHTPTTFAPRRDQEQDRA